MLGYGPASYRFSRSAFAVSAVASSSWGESSITFSNAPPLGAQLGSSEAWSTTGSKRVMQPVSAVAPGLNSYALTTTSTNSKTFDSREGANTPQLIVNYTT